MKPAGENKREDRPVVPVPSLLLVRTYHLSDRPGDAHELMLLVAAGWRSLLGLPALSATAIDIAIEVLRCIQRTLPHGPKTLHLVRTV